jgi:LysR family glycine cleavage system transcriptional activator
LWEISAEIFSLLCENISTMSLPPFSGLEALEAVARRGSFAAAAQELGVTTSAVSHRVRGLEAQLDVTLFDRSERRAQLTPDGRRLADAVALARATLLAAVDEVVRPSGPLTIACSPSFAVKWLVPSLDDLRALHPDLIVHVDARDVADPASHRVDGVVHYGPPGVGVTLRTEEVFPVCAPLIAEQLDAPERLLAQTLLVDDAHREHPARAGWPAWLRAAGVDEAPARSRRFSHNHLALSAASAGQGVALARTSLVEADLEAGRLVAPFALRIPTGLSYQWIAGSARDEAVAFGRWLLDRFGVDADVH